MRRPDLCGALAKTGACYLTLDRCSLRLWASPFRPGSALVNQPSTCKGHGRGFAEESTVVLAVLTHMRESAGPRCVADRSTRPRTQQSHSITRQSLTPDKGQRRRVVDLPEPIFQCSFGDAAVPGQLSQRNRRRESLVHQAASGDDSGNAQFFQKPGRGVAIFVEQHAAPRHGSTRLDHEDQQVSPAGQEEIDMRTSTRAHQPVRSQALSEKASVRVLRRREQHAGTIRRHAPADGDSAARMQSEDSMRAECDAGHRCGVTTRCELDQFQPPAGEQARYLFDFTIEGLHGPQSTLARAAPLSKKRTHRTGGKRGSARPQMRTFTIRLSSSSSEMRVSNSGMIGNSVTVTS